MLKNISWRRSSALSSFAFMQDLPKPRPIVALTGVRAFIAWWVVLFHAKTHLMLLLPEIAHILGPVIGSGHMRVDLFFVLSGFVLSYRYAPEMQSTEQLGGGHYRNFVARRWWRIYPLHFLTLMLLVFLAALANLSGSDPGILRGSSAYDFMTNLLLIQAWILPMEFSWNFPAWSLSSEWLAYLTFPFLCILLWRIKQAQTALIFAILMLIMMAVICHSLAAAELWGYDFMVRLITEFSAGCLLFHVFRAGLLEHLRWDVWTPVLFVGALVGGFTMERYGWDGYWLVPAFSFFLFGLAYERGPAARLFERPGFQYWGRRSYSLYITHALTLVVLVVLIPAQNFSDSGLLIRIVVFALYIICIALAGLITYKFIEDPLRKLDIVKLWDKLRNKSKIM